MSGVKVTSSATSGCTSPSGGQGQFDFAKLEIDGRQRSEEEPHRWPPAHQAQNAICVPWPRNGRGSRYPWATNRETPKPISSFPQTARISAWKAFSEPWACPGQNPLPGKTAAKAGGAETAERGTELVPIGVGQELSPPEHDQLGNAQQALEGQGVPEGIAQALVSPENMTFVFAGIQRMPLQQQFNLMPE